MAKKTITNLEVNVRDVRRYSVFVSNVKQDMLDLRALVISSTGKVRKHLYPHSILSARNAVMVVSMIRYK